MNFVRRWLRALRDPNDVFLLVDCYFHHTTHTDASNTNWWDLLHDLFGQWYCIREHSNRCYWDRSPPQQYWLFAMIICIQSSAAAASKNAQLSLKASQTVSIAQKTISKATQKSSQIWFPIMCKKKKNRCLSRILLHLKYVRRNGSNVFLQLYRADWCNNDLCNDYKLPGRRHWDLSRMIDQAN